MARNRRGKEQISLKDVEGVPVKIAGPETGGVDPGSEIIEAVIKSTNPELVVHWRRTTQNYATDPVYSHILGERAGLVPALEESDKGNTTGTATFLANYFIRKGDGAPNGLPSTDVALSGIIFAEAISTFANHWNETTAFWPDSERVVETYKGLAENLKRLALLTNPEVENDFEELKKLHEIASEQDDGVW